jgi:hypothetical protein
MTQSSPPLQAPPSPPHPPYSPLTNSRASSAPGATVNPAANATPPDIAAIVAGLASYAPRPEAARLEQLEALVAACVRDEGFAVLCEDLEGLWQRIGLDARR